MKIGAYMTAVRSLEVPKTQRASSTRFMDRSGLKTAESGGTWALLGSRLGDLKDTAEEEKKEAFGEEETPKDRSEALKIYEAVKSGGRNPIEELRRPPKVPYEHLAKDGVINYNGVCFVCDEKTNSICLGDMTDEKNVLNIPLSGGGHLKVNRANIGQLSKAAGMFTPEDLNLIMRAIALDTKLQETEDEIDDMEANVGNQLKGGGESEEA